jgi:hypothetical protein
MSTVRADNFGPSAGGTTRSLRGIAAAWANLNGTGTIALRDSQNVSSVVDNGVGDYSFNYSNAAANANYSVHTVNSRDTTAAFSRNVTITQEGALAPTTSYLRVQSVQSGSTTLLDIAFVSASIHGDLA